MADTKPIDTGDKTVTGRTIWNDPETGEDYSERSTTFEIDGKFYTMPTVSEDGRQHTEDQIRNYVKENGPIDYLTGEELPEFRYIEDAIEYAISRSSTRKQTDMAQGGVINQTEEALGYAAEGKKFADDFGPVSNVTFKDVGKFVAEMTPIVGDAMAAKQVYDELQKDEPNYYLAGALGGAALIGLFPGIGDIAAKAIRKGAREVFDVAKRVEVDPNAMGSGLGNVKLKPKEEPLKNVEPLEIGTSKFNIENPTVVLKNHTAKELKTIDLTRSTAGGPTKNKLINAPVKENEEVSVRLNLNSKIDPDGPAAPFNRLQTVHPVKANGKPNYSKANSYRPAVTVKNGTFHVDQNKRRSIAEDGMKVPAMSVQGNFISKRNVLEEMDDTVVQIGANPKDGHLFVDKKTGQAVKSFEIATIYRDRVYAKGVTYWKKTDAPEPLPAKGDVPITNQVRYKFNEGGAIPMNNQMELFGDGGLKDEGGTIDEVSGNEVPVGGTKEGVRDDIPANVSEGEFIFPADVVRFVGLDKLMQIRQDAKMGLKKMEAMGQMGNSDEATMDDDMPFGMADLVVVGGKGEPMEFADGGFVPVENFYHGGVAHNDNVLDTADVPTTDTTEVIDYEAYMNSVITEVKEYRNAEGEKINITFINGVPFPPIPDNFTLYIPDENEPPSEETQIANVINKNNNNDSYKQVSNMSDSEIANASKTGPNYVAMSDDEFIERMKYENTTSYKLQKTLGLGIASMVPFGGILAYGSMRGHARASEERLRDIISKQTDQTKINEYTTILNNTLKSSGLTASEDSTKFAQGLDGFLTGKGYTTAQVNNATSVVSNPEDNVTNIMNNAASESSAPTTSLRPQIRTPNTQLQDTDTQIKNRIAQIKEKVKSGGVMTPEEYELIANETSAMTKSLGTPSPESIAAVDDLLAGKPNNLLATTRAAKQTSAPTTSLRPQIRTPNTQLQDMANRLTPGDGKEYKFGKLRDAKGNRVNTMYQKLANALTLNDGKSYVGGVLIDESTEQPIQQTQQDSFNPATQGTFKAGNSPVGVLSRIDLSASSPNLKGAYNNGIYAGDGFEWNFSGGRTATGKNQGATGSTDIVQGRFEDSQGNYVDFKNIENYGGRTTLGTDTNTSENTSANTSAGADSGTSASKSAGTSSNTTFQNNDKKSTKVTQATRNKINTASDNLDKATGPAGQSTVRKDAGITFKKSDNDRGFTGGFNKGGLASKPKVKKTKTTNKRGLAARK